ncbi:hypothetical protein [Flavobacterium algicola]|uniref:hypothetical protein n=1 Tax=Flavobacterium algicola TaxID=556529 RepID=UPI001EFE931A|nr:hypothetical protein [Flavobacterium algicola]MCG9791068.1 hypothetical protein [Flavobacterium algicola]
MKKALLIIALAGILFSCVSTEDTILSTTGVSLQQSSENWNDLKKIKGNSYNYDTATTSWTGTNSVTQIIVVNDKVTARNYETFTMNSQNIKIITNSYFEDKNNLGSNIEGTKPVTIEEVYSDCSQNYLSAKTKDNMVIFKTDSNGIINTCGYTIKNCQDDCFVGIKITSILWNN